MEKTAKQKVVKISPAGGWRGVAVEKYSNIDFGPDKLGKNPKKIFKADDPNMVGLVELDCQGQKRTFVFKKNVSKFNLKTVLDIFRGNKALRNFRFALKLQNRGIETAAPIAAFWRIKSANHVENIYITDYKPSGLSLYDVAFGKDEKILSDFALRKSVITQTVKMLVMLQNAGYWHRDSKAGNFVTYKKDSHQAGIELIDLDGIKLNIFNKRKNNIRTLSKLAETLTRFKAVTLSDFYRGFLCYCSAMQKNGPESRKLFRKIERMTVARRLSTIVSDSYKSSK